MVFEAARDGRLAGRAEPGRARRVRLGPGQRPQDAPDPGGVVDRCSPTCSTRRWSGPARSWSTRTPSCRRERAGRRRAERSASARSSTPTSPTTGSRTTSSTGTGCCRSNGNTATYLQYAHARMRSIFRRGEVLDIDALAAAPPLVREPAERALALHLLGFERAVRQTAELLEPHRLAGLPVRPGVGVHVVLRRLPRAEGRRPRGAPEPPAAVRPHRQDAGPRPRPPRHRGPRTHVAPPVRRKSCRCEQ